MKSISQHQFTIFEDDYLINMLSTKFLKRFMQWCWIFLLSIPGTTLLAQSLWISPLKDIHTGELIDSVSLIISSENDSGSDAIVYSGFITKECGEVNLLSSNINQDHKQELDGNLMIKNNSVYWGFNSKVQILIYSREGRFIYSSGNPVHTGQFHVPDLPDGICYLSVISSRNKKNYAFINLDNKQLLLNMSPEQSHQLTANNSYKLTFYKEGYHDLTANIERPIKGVLDSLFFYLLKESYDSLNYFTYLHSYPAYQMITGKPSSHFGVVESVKAIIDKKKDLVYYMNTSTYNSHYTFAVEQLDYPYSHEIFNIQQYLDNPARYFYPVTLNYYPDLAYYTFEFFSGDEAGCEDVQYCYELLKASSYLEDDLFFYASNASWNNCKEVPKKEANDLYAGVNYQALNLAENYGYFHRIDLKQIDTLDLQRHDLIMVDGIPIDIPVIAGIITTEFQAPLSHINVLSHNRGTPNMALKNAFENPVFDLEEGSLIYLAVRADTFEVRTATYSEANEFWTQHEPVDSVILNKNTLVHGIVELDTAGLEDIACIGGKAANFSELLNAFDHSQVNAPVPEGYFAIPFYYYQAHIEQHGIDTLLEHYFQHPEFMQNNSFRKQCLLEIQDNIIQSPLDSSLLILVQNKLSSIEGFNSFRFRSSTNAEDIEGFNGAGLYNSYTAEPFNPAKPVDMAIKKVWASLWNYRAFEERSYFNIDPSSCAMGILVHRSFPDEDANGVAITSNPNDVNHGFLVNVQYGEQSIVYPSPGIIHDQLVIYTYSLSGEHPFTIQYLSHSNLYPTVSGNVMEDVELYQLGHYLSIIKDYFYQYVYPTGMLYKDFTLDIEFKIDSSINPRTLYIKQVRPY